MPAKKSKTASPAAARSPASLPAQGAAPAKRGKPAMGQQGAPVTVGTNPVPRPEPAAPPSDRYKDFQPPAEFAFWSDEEHNELAEAWLALNERHQKFFREWYTNGFKATEAYVQTYNQENRHVARVCACQLLATPNILRLRRAIWKVQLPPIELMTAAEHAALEADETTDPKAYKTHLMKLSAVKSIREAHGLQPAQDLNLTVKGKVDHEHSGEVGHKVDISDDVKGLLNGGG